MVSRDSNKQSSEQQQASHLLKNGEHPDQRSSKLRGEENPIRNDSEKQHTEEGTSAPATRGEPSSQQQFQKRNSLLESLRGQLSAEIEPANLPPNSASRGSADQRSSDSKQPQDCRLGAYDKIEIDLLDVDDCSGDLDEPGSNNVRKRIFSQSDVDFGLIDQRKKINPFSSTLSAAPYYYHDF